MNMNEILSYVAARGRRVPYVDVLNADPDQSAARDNTLRMQALLADGLLSGRTGAGGELSLTPAGQKQLDKLAAKRKRAIKKAEQARMEAEKAAKESRQSFVLSIIAIVISVVDIIVQLVLPMIQKI